MYKFEEVRINHIYKEGNSKVDQVANIGTNDNDILQFTTKKSHI